MFITAVCFFLFLSVISNRFADDTNQELDKFAIWLGANELSLCK